MLDQSAINSLKNSGFRVNNDSYIKESEELHITVTSTTIVVTNKVTLEADVYEYNEPNLLSVINTKASKEASTPLDLSISSKSEEDNSVSSEVKNRALAKMDDEFMSQVITVNDCKALGFILKLESLNELVSLIIGDFEFCCSLTNLDAIKFKVILSTIVPSPHLKVLINPTRKQVDEVYHFFTGEHLDFSPKQKVYNWENCFDYNGWFTATDSIIRKNHSTDTKITNINVYPTKEDAESALAHCQLLHIVNKINEDYLVDEDLAGNTFIYYNTTEGILDSGYDSLHDNTLKLNSKTGAKVLIRDNEQLLKTYFKIK